MTEVLGTGALDETKRRPLALLVGRATEQVFLREELAAAVGGQGRLVLLGGDAGIGKTSLAKDLGREVAERRGAVLTGHCYDLTNTPPYGPWLDLFEAYEPTAGQPDAPAALAGGRLGRVTDQAALFAEVRRFFADLGAARPTMVVLEDLHWSDPLSLELLRSVASQVGRLRVLLLVTYRADELTHRHPLYRQLPALVHEGDGLRLDLRALDTAALRHLAAERATLPAADEDRLVAYLERHSDGNPFLATELLRALQDDGVLTRAGTGWSLAPLDRVVVPTLLRQVIDGRLDRLGEQVRHALAVAAVIGQEVPLALWARLLEIDDEASLEIVERAVEAHVLDAERDGIRVRFVHALTREALYEAMLPPRRRHWNVRVAEALMEDPNSHPDAVAFHLQEAGDPRAWTWLVKAADRAHRAYAYGTAAERLRAAVAGLEGVDGEERTRRLLFFRLGYMLRFSDPLASIVATDEADRLAIAAGDTALSAEIRDIRGFWLCYVDRFREGLIEMGRAAESLASAPLDVRREYARTHMWVPDAWWQGTGEGSDGDDPGMVLLADAALDHAHCSQLWHVASVGYSSRAIAMGGTVIDALAGLPDDLRGAGDFIAFTWHGLGVAHAALGGPDEARRYLGLAQERFGVLDHFMLRAFALMQQSRDVAVPYGAADPAERRRLAAEAEAMIGRAGGALRPGVSPRMAWLGCLVLDGRWDEAREILEGLPEIGNSYLRREVTAAQVTLAAHDGHPEVVEWHIQARFPDGPATEPGDSIHQEGLFLQRIAAESHLDSGDQAGARAWLEAHDRWLDWSSGVLGRADGRLLWARWHRASADVAAAHAAVSEAIALADSPAQPLVRAAAHRTLGELDTASGLGAMAEAHLTMALAIEETCEAPFERALTLLALAELRLVTGATREAAALVDEVRAVCARLGAEPTLRRAEALAARIPTRANAAPPPARLTPRELEVLRLLAQRLSNPEIADVLVVGQRTVQTHVEHILGKLGVSNRREAAAAAARLGLI